MDHTLGYIGIVVIAAIAILALRGRPRRPHGDKTIEVPDVVTDHAAGPHGSDGSHGH